MSAEVSRIILRTAGTARQEIRELLVGLLAAELVAPSRCIWLVSPWLRDVALLDNRSAAFRGVGPGWARREVSLFDVLAELTRRGSELIVATRPGDGNDASLVALQRAVGDGPAAKRLRSELRPQLHAKGLVGDDYCLSGSMNFTRNGIEHLDEMVTYTTDPEHVGALRIEFAQEYGGLA
jgi:phosphatidylserine/phosphatidylglycerophosphate/cardiolipin synthase-like enzyme